MLELAAIVTIQIAEPFKKSAQMTTWLALNARTTHTAIAQECHPATLTLTCALLVLETPTAQTLLCLNATLVTTLVLNVLTTETATVGYLLAGMIIASLDQDASAASSKATALILGVSFATPTSAYRARPTMTVPWMEEKWMKIDSAKLTQEELTYAKNVSLTLIANIQREPILNASTITNAEEPDGAFKDSALRNSGGLLNTALLMETTVGVTIAALTTTVRETLFAQLETVTALLMMTVLKARIVMALTDAENAH